MYETSQAYKTAIRSNSRPYDTVYGTVYFSDETTLTIDSSIMPTNAVSISKQCIDGDELMFGGVFSNELKLSLITDKDRYAFFDAKIELFYKIEIAEDTFEEIPIGVFTVADADRPHDIVNLTAYDNMTMLDGSIGGNVISGTLWEIFQRIKLDTNMDLAFTEEDLQDFPNYEYSLEASQDRGINTYRDICKMICQMLGCFGYADREGRLALKKFSTTPDLALTSGNWYSCVPADYLTHYVGLSVTSTSGTYSASSTDPLEVGSIMIIEDAPAWDLGSEASLRERTTELFTYLHSIDYTPCELDMPSDASFDCGDMLALTLRDGTTINTIITSMEWKFHSGMSISSEGINPYLSQEAMIDNSGQRIINQAVAKSKLQFVHFTNPSSRVIGDTETGLVAEVEFTPTADTDALFVATILVDADVSDTTTTTTETVSVPITVTDQQGQPAVITDLQGNPLTVTGTATNTYTYARDGKCDVSIFYKLNGLRVPNENDPYIAVEELENGQHIITLAYPLTALLAWQRYEWQIYMTVGGGTISIPANTVKASLFGQEINIVDRFDGRIRVEDEINLINLGKLGVISVSDNVTINITGGAFISVSDDVSLYNISNVTPLNLYEGTGELAPQIFLQGGHRITTDDGDYITTDDGDRLITD